MSPRHSRVGWNNGRSDRRLKGLWKEPIHQSNRNWQPLLDQLVGPREQRRRHFQASGHSNDGLQLAKTHFQLSDVNASIVLLYDRELLLLWPSERHHQASALVQLFEEVWRWSPGARSD